MRRETDTAEDITVDTAEETDTAAQDTPRKRIRKSGRHSEHRFSSVQDEFNELYGSAIPAPIQDMGDITTYAAFSVQWDVRVANHDWSAGQNVTCPRLMKLLQTGLLWHPLRSLEMVAPVKRAKPTVERWCMVLKATYTDYTVVSPSENENCADAFYGHCNGGMRGGDGEATSFLVKLQNEEFNDDYSVQPSTMFLNGLATIDEISEEETHVNGELTFLIAGEEYSMWFDAVTTDGC